jgi:hypothetical protein
MTRAEILVVIDKERYRQMGKWNREHEWGYGDCSSETGSLGPWQAIGAHGVTAVSGELALQYSNLIKASVLAEEAGEVVKAALDIDESQFYAEVVQTLAVAWAILEGRPE